MTRHFCFNPTRMDPVEAPRACLATWRDRDARLKVHFSSPRTDWGFRYGSDGKSRAPNWSSHVGFADPIAFIAFYRAIADLAPDVILEAKAKDVAVMHLRRDLGHCAPNLLPVFCFE